MGTGKPVLLAEPFRTTDGEHCGWRVREDGDDAASLFHSQAEVRQYAVNLGAEVFFSDSVIEMTRFGDEAGAGK